MLRIVVSVCLGWLMLSAAPAQAKRFALLIGNQDYAREVGPLANPVNDVKLIDRALRQIGFADDSIRIVENASRRTILSEVDRYADRLAAAGPDAVGFFYYSGHGAANRRDRQNYLIPVEAKALDSSVWYDAVRLDGVVSKLKARASNAAHFVIFDACRNLLNMPTKGGKGFAPVSSRRGMLIAFSTDPGETASDEGDGSGPYAAALAAELVKPGLDHVSLFQNVKERVVAKVRNQVPWERNGLVRRVYLAGERGQQSAQPVTPQPPMSEAAIAWGLVAKSNNCVVVKAFQRQFAGTVWQAIASAKFEEMKCEQVASAAPLASSLSKMPESKSAGGTTMIIFDASGSMWGALSANGPPKFEAARAGLKAALDTHSHRALGLVIFGNSESIMRRCKVEVAVEPAGKRLAPLVEALRSLNPRGRAAVAQAVRKAGLAMQGTPGPHRLVLIYDGPDNCREDACLALTEVRSRLPGLSVDVVAIGVAPDDQAAMACVTEDPGGRVMRVDRVAEMELAISAAITGANYAPLPGR